MLADSPNIRSQGALSEGILQPEQSRVAILEFIGGELPKWRDRPGRPAVTAETRLTSQLCGHLNSAARHSPGWDGFQFRVEEGDETVLSRTMDLIASAAGTVIVEGRSYEDYETILPIECKRLPTPSGNNRDPREYVVTDPGSTGGIQRFKEGSHASSHSRAGMIGFVQGDTLDHWYCQVQKWISELQAAGRPGWSQADELTRGPRNVSSKLDVHDSIHTRPGRQPIYLKHFWIQM